MKWSFDFDKEINFMLLDYIWNELNKVNDYSESFKSTVKHISFSETNIEEYIQNNRIKFVSIKNLSESNRSYLTDLSFKIDILRELGQGTKNIEKLFKPEVIEQLNINMPSHPMPKLVNQSEISKIFSNWPQISNLALLNEHFSVVDPISGKLIQSQDSFLIDKGITSITYRFVSQEVFFVSLYGWNPNILTFFYPRFNLVISLNDFLGQITIENQINLFKKMVLKNLYLYFEYINNNIERNISLLLGNCSNMGHHFLQELTGFNSLFNSSFWGKLKSILVLREKGISLDLLFPEIKKIQNFYLKDKKSEDKFKFCLEKKLFLVSCKSNIVKSDFKIRLLEKSWQKFNEDLIYSTIEKRFSNQVFPLILINLRNHSKSWINQIEGFSFIINKLHSRYPNLGIVFDGFDDCISIKNAILKNVESQNIYNLDCLGCLMNDSIVVANLVDFYITTLGAGLVLTSLLTEKHGVAISNLAHLGQQVWWSSLSENSIEPLFVKREHIHDPKPSGYSNYDIDINHVYDLVETGIKNVDISLDKWQLIIKSSLPG